MNSFEYITRYKAVWPPYTNHITIKTKLSQLLLNANLLFLLIISSSTIKVNCYNALLPSLAATTTTLWPSIVLNGTVQSMTSENGTVFIVAGRNVYRFDSNLTLLHATTATGCFPQDRTISSQTDLVNKILLIFNSAKNQPEHLFSCWQNTSPDKVDPLMCCLFKSQLTSGAYLEWRNSSFKTGQNEYLIASQSETRGLIIATSRLTTHQQVNTNDEDAKQQVWPSMPALARFKMNFEKEKGKIFLEKKSALPYSSRSDNYTLFRHFVNIFDHGDHTLMILNDIRKPYNSDDSTIHMVRLARVCKNDTQLTSYTEISLSCNNEPDIYAKVAQLDDAKSEPTLYIIFESNDDPRSKKANAKSYLCSYSMTFIDDIFYKAISDCNNGLQSSHLLAKLHPQVNHGLICQRNPANDWCTSQINPYIDGNAPIYHFQQDSFLDLNSVTSVNFFHVVTQGSDSKEVYFIGTRDGLLSKIGSDGEPFYTIDLNSNRVRFYKATGDKLSGVPFNGSLTGSTETKYSTSSGKIYAATGARTISALDVNGCHYYNSCRACSEVRDPLDCVWCGDSCRSKKDCPDDNQPFRCQPTIREFNPREGPITGSTELAIEGDSFGDPESPHLSVVLSGSPCTVDSKRSSSERILCITRRVDRPFSANISISVSDNSTSWIPFYGTTTANDLFKFKEVEVFGLHPPFGPMTNSQTKIEIYGQNLDVGSNHKILIGQEECVMTDKRPDRIECYMKAQPSASGENSHQELKLKIFIDGQQQPIEFRPLFNGLDLATNFEYRAEVRNEEIQTEESEPSSLGNIIIIIMLLIIIPTLFVCVTHQTRFPKLRLKIMAPFKLKETDVEETEVSFRNPQSQKFSNSPSTNVRLGESVNALIKLNGSVISSDYFGNPMEQQEQDKPLIRSFVDTDLLTELDQEKILIDRRKLTLGHTLGSGQFGRVYKGFLKIEETGEHVDVAVKTLHNRGNWDDSADNRAFLEEGLMMRDFEHENVLALIGVTVDSNGMPMVITPFMLYGDLRSYISDEASSPTVKELIEFGTQIAKGMAYLSGLKFVHRDLAARNCMLDKNMIVKIADFGLSRDIYERDYYSSDNKKAKLPVKWMAIESLERSIYNTKTDVWSYGVVLWELMTRGVVPYPDVDNFDLFSYLKEGRRMLRPRFCPVILYNIMLSCWNENSASRPTFDELVEGVSDVITQLRDAKDDNGQQKVSRETYCDVLR